MLLNVNPFAQDRLLVLVSNACQSELPPICQNTTGREGERKDGEEKEGDESRGKEGAG